MELVGTVVLAPGCFTVNRLFFTTHGPDKSLADGPKFCLNRTPDQ